MIKKILIKIINYFCQVKYEIGFVSENELPHGACCVLKDIKWLKTGGYKSGWFADPFILSVTDNFVQVLAEEFSYRKKKGSISLLKIRRGDNEYKLENVKTILELDTHLSFPLIFKENGKVYVCPENYQSGGVSVYEYNERCGILENPLLIISDPLVDVQIVKDGNSYYALGVVCKNGSMEETRRINVYKSDTLLGKYEYVQTIVNDYCEERGAGQIYTENGQIIRPAQCCEGGYGKMLINKQIKIENNKIKETEKNRYKPIRSKKNGLSLHTFNKENGLCVVDGHDYKNCRIVSRIVAPIIDVCLSRYYNHMKGK